MFGTHHFCLCCLSHTYHYTILKLDDQASASAFLLEPTETLETHPLSLIHCVECGHLEEPTFIHSDILFKNYAFTANQSASALEYYDWFVKFTEKYFDNYYPTTVLDIGCNNGAQLDAYLKQGYATYGVEPSEKHHELSSVNHTVLCGYAELPVLKKFTTKMDIIILQNILDLCDGPVFNLRYCRGVFNSEEGFCFVEFNSHNLIQDGRFDFVYHERRNFFSIKSFTTLIRTTGFYLYDIYTSGNKIIFVLTGNFYKRNKTLTDSILEESILDLEILENFSHNVNECLKKLQSDVFDFRQQGFPIIGYGLNAGSNTIINSAKISLDYIIDEDESKHNLYTPGSTIKIISMENFLQLYPDQSVAWLPLIPDLTEEIKNKIITYRPNMQDKFIEISFLPL